MRFTIKREELLKGLNIASRAVASKVAVPVLANLKFELNKYIKNKILNFFT